jgi:hypothetical protein
VFLKVRRSRNSQAVARQEKVMTTEREYTHWYLGIAVGTIQSATALRPLIRGVAQGNASAQAPLVEIIVAMRDDFCAHQIPPLAAPLADTVRSTLSGMIAAAQLPPTGQAGYAALGEAAVSFDDVEAQITALHAQLSSLD